MQPEAKFKRKLVESYEKRYPKGWYQFNRARLKYGVPDLYFSLPFKKSVWIEAKQENGQLRDIQRAVGSRMAGAGERVCILTCPAPPIRLRSRLTLQWIYPLGPETPLVDLADFATIWDEICSSSTPS